MKTILLIEDDATFSRTLRLLLQCQGYGVIPAADIAEAAEKLNAHFDFILCEINLPEHQELLRMAQEKNPAIRVIFITPTSSRDVMCEVLNEGASCMIKKPIDHEILHAILLALEIGGNKLP